MIYWELWSLLATYVNEDSSTMLDNVNEERKPLDRMSNFRGQLLMGAGLNS